MDRSSRTPFAPPQLNKNTAADYSSSASESEDEQLEPGVENDFGDFNPRKRRKLGGNNKERAALGIFGSDSEDEGPGKKWKSKNLRRKGMSFVSNATGDKESEEDDKPVLGGDKMDVDEDEDEDEEDEQNGSGVGLGFGRGMSGLRTRVNGWKKAEDTPEEAPAPAVKSTFDGTDVLGKAWVPSSDNQPVLNETALKNDNPPVNKPQVSSFGKKGKMGFGAKMMAKMGYVEGGGLGKEGQGRNVIVEANLRPQGIGLGAVKEKSEQERQEEKRQAKMRGETVVDSDEEEKKRKRKAKAKKTLGGAFDSASSTPRRQKTKYLTADELKASAPGLNIPDAFTPILDMTGPGGKKITSGSGIMTPISGVPESADVIEARKLVKRAQADLMAFSEEWRSLEERKKWVDLELNERETEVEALRSDFDKLQVFSDLVTQQLASATEWDTVMGCLQKTVELGIATADVTDIAVAAIHPFLRDADWDPLAEPAKFASDLKGLSGLLMPSANDGKVVSRWDSTAVDPDDIYRTHHKATSTYESMMYKNWLPRVLSAVRTWDPLEPTPLLSLIETWTDLLPPFVRAQLVDNIVRKLESALSDWNPKKKRQSHHLPHTWLFPWLQYLPSYHLDPKGTGLVSEVKRKFRQLADVWEFERGVVPGLSQWEAILGDQWRPLIMSHVLPSMGRYLRRNFRVDPADQEPYLPVLMGVLKWNGMLGTPVLAEVLVQSMFPMWNAKLEEWLTLEEADLAEVAEWYTWWRETMLKDYLGIRGVRLELDKGLKTMNMV